jgi:hypothetical protein
VKLAELNDSYPIELAEFAKARGIADEPAFAWWVPHTLRRRNAILSAVKARVRKKTHKYGIEVPTSLELLLNGKSAPQGWTKASGLLIWDLQMDFTRKARWVLDGQKCQKVCEGGVVP